MKQSERGGAQGAEHRHWSEEELFEHAWDSRTPRSSCESCELRLTQLRAGLARLRALAAESEAPQTALAERILAATVGETLGWRGDLRLVVSFARDRLRASPWLRLAAALLVFHAAALPVLAWIVLRTDPPAPHFFSALEPLPRESGFAEPDVEAALPLEGQLVAEPRVMEVGAEDAAPSVRWRAEMEQQSEELQRFDWPAADAASRPEDAFESRLWARSRQALSAEAPPAAWEVERAQLEPSALDARRADLLALELEIELDRWVRGGERGPASRRAAQLAAFLEQRSGAAAGDSELARLALARAARLGASPSSDALGERSGVFDAAWFEALERAAVDPNGRLLRAWLARGARK